MLIQTVRLYRLKELDCAAHLRDSCRDRGRYATKENPIVLTFAIDRNNHITALPATQQAQVNPDVAPFSSTEERDCLAKRWPGPRLVKPVKKFTNRKVAVTRIWVAQGLAPDRGTAGLRLVPQKTKAGKRASPRKNPGPARRRGKTGRVLELLRRADGVTLKQLMSATQWQAHSVRGFLSGALKKKMGLKILSTKGTVGERRYSIQA
jgi:hypothetical protein